MSQPGDQATPPATESAPAATSFDFNDPTWLVHTPDSWVRAIVAFMFNKAVASEAHVTGVVEGAILHVMKDGDTLRVRLRFGDAAHPSGESRLTLRP